MRLTKEQIQIFLDVIKQEFGSVEFELYLYGSRTQDNLKGGDIDLLIITSEAGVELFHKKNLDILVKIKKHNEIGQRRIDLKAHTGLDLDQIAFLKQIKTTLVKIG